MSALTQLETLVPELRCHIKRSGRLMPAADQLPSQGLMEGFQSPRRVARRALWTDQCVAQD
jgi:hypothetical protein